MAELNKRIFLPPPHMGGQELEFVKQAFNYIAPLGPHVDAFEREFSEMVKKTGFEADVVFLGFQKDVPFYISLMDVVVLPSHHEGFPRIPVEAGAMGKPSISTATAGADVAIDEGKTGFTVPIKYPCRLGEAIQKIITDTVLAQTMGNYARQRVIDLFDQDKIVDQQVQMYADFFRRNEKTKGYHV